MNYPHRNRYTLRLHPVWMSLLLCVGLIHVAIAQTDTSRTKRGATDSLATPLSTAVADSVLMQRDSVFYTRLKTSMYKRRLTRQLYDAVFRDVYNSRRQTGEVNQIEINPFKRYEGRIIGSIHFRRLGVFGQTVYDTLRKPGNWAERVGNRLHTNTKENVIRRSYLLFREGDAVNPNVLRDNERLLRTIPIFTDARILIVPREGSRQFVEVYVITQDVWSLLPLGGFGGFNNYSVGFEQRNFQGLGHQLFVQFAHNGTDPRQKAEFQTRYTIPFIGKTFLTAQAELLLLRNLKQGSVRLFRPFITPDTKYAGAIELNHTQVNNRIITRDDSVLLVPVSYNYTDVWVGRSFRLFYKPQNSEEVGRSRLIVALRYSNYDYMRRPAVRADTNQFYQDSRTVLFSVGFSRRKYIRDVLIYGFGRTEDVPIGETFAVTTGVDNAEFGPRGYMGINFSQGKYIRKAGYLYGLINLGSFTRSTGFEQGVLSMESNYFSPLLDTRWGNIRHFFNVRYTTGIGRFLNEYITLNSNGSGIQTDGIGISSDALRGTKRLLLSYENILFGRFSLVGFRVAFITFANIGLVSFQDRALLRGPLYQGYGIGFRLRNENLTFNSFQIRLAYYPNIPGNRLPFRQAFEGVPTLRFRDFDLSAPAIIPYR
ncbi:hypothetical protein [Spirosoma montaniterrae]|uniref:Bacterial surface antigen (D15) domain-containing protein n=1 Tax=Spirosoma montaniterrae TaxID=1178516 RepID=A0A1P9WWV1_9BACT|nr:hypothetical protein [Spirosoma montaniterrae]AQG79867.1 hypothetical protein AWR27_11340 [Spirosoma montaniterrae]